MQVRWVYLDPDRGATLTRSCVGRMSEDAKTIADFPADLRLGPAVYRPPEPITPAHAATFTDR